MALIFFIKSCDRAFWQANPLVMTRWKSCSKEDREKEQLRLVQRHYLTGGSSFNNGKHYYLKNISKSADEYRLWRHWGDKLLIERVTFPDPTCHEARDVLTLALSCWLRKESIRPNGHEVWWPRIYCWIRSKVKAIRWTSLLLGLLICKGKGCNNASSERRRNKVACALRHLGSQDISALQVSSI